MSTFLKISLFSHYKHITQNKHIYKKKHISQNKHTFFGLMKIWLLWVGPVLLLFYECKLLHTDTLADCLDWSLSGRQPTSELIWRMTDRKDVECVSFLASLKGLKSRRRNPSN